MKILNKLFYIVNITLALLILIGDACYISFGKLWIKGLTSSLFVLMGIANLLLSLYIGKKNLKFSIFMLIGLVFAMCGDIVLNIEFIIGAVLFAIGHIFYFISYSFILKFKWTDLLFGLLILIPSVLFITLAPIFNFNVLMEIVCVVYAVIISFMVGKSIANLARKRNLLNLIILIGSCLFFFSDLMLLLNVFANLPRIVDILCLATYYPAQILLAFSVFNPTKEFFSKNKNNNKIIENKEN